jgi:hypothetical protein
MVFPEKNYLTWKASSALSVTDSGGIGMISSVIEKHANALDCEISQDTISVILGDGRTVSAPLEWFPRLLHATDSEKKNWALIGDGEGLHWPEADEYISVASLLQGIPSQESGASLQRWLDTRP